MRTGDSRSLLFLVLFVSLAVTVTVPAAQRSGGAALTPVLDPARVQDQDDMTWADYRPIPGTRWADNALAPGRAIRVALVAIDFEDQPFVITQKKQSDPFGNPQVESVRREDVAKFYAAFWGTPGPLNHGHTIHEYWMEQSRGRVGIPKIDAYGPYRMPRRLFEYGLNEYNQASGCPTGFTCNGRMEPDADALWMADAGADVRKKYDVILRIYAGYDETTVWQEFGEMKFRSRDDIPAAWGNPDTTKPRWVTTRYVPWTSWLAGTQQWGLSSVRQGESSGTITHELGHLIFRVGDNNNNPYVTPYRRVGTGPWDMMDRGSFNGPGGPHRRWVVPAAEGAAMPAGLMLRNRMVMGVLPTEQVVRLSREALAASGVAIARIIARAVEPMAGTFAGISVRLDGAAPHDRTPACDRNADPLCAGDPAFTDYSLEVVQRIGYDSFTPDNGVLIAKNKDRQDGSCGYSCHAWVIDATSEDMNRVDFVKPDGTRVMRTIADYRQSERRALPRGAAVRHGVRVEGRSESTALLRRGRAARRERHSFVHARCALARRGWRAGARCDGDCAGHARRSRDRRPARRARNEYGRHQEARSFRPGDSSRSTGGHLCERCLSGLRVCRGRRRHRRPAERPGRDSSGIDRDGAGVRGAPVGRRRRVGPRDGHRRLGKRSVQARDGHDGRAIGAGDSIDPQRNGAAYRHHSLAVASPLTKSSRSCATFWRPLALGCVPSLDWRSLQAHDRPALLGVVPSAQRYGPHPTQGATAPGPEYGNTPFS